MEATLPKTLKTPPQRPTISFGAVSEITVPAQRTKSFTKESQRHQHDHQRGVVGVVT